MSYDGPVICFGYHQFEPTYETWDDDNPPTQCAIPWMESWSKAKSVSWEITSSRKFSYDGRPVPICPECYKRYQAELDELAQQRSEKFNELLERMENVTSYKELDHIRNEFWGMRDITEAEIDLYYNT